MTEASPQDVLHFWFTETPPKRWFTTDSAFDAVVRARFEPLWRQATEGKRENFQADSEGMLAFILVCDQFPRNMFRGAKAAFSSDALALAAAKRAVERGDDLTVQEPRRSFFYLPFMHSENLEDQDRCVRLTAERMGQDHYSWPFALRHRDTIARFMRFPARNRALGRESTEEETAFLASHPAGF